MGGILEMVRAVAVFYLLEQMVLHLLPGRSYEKYVRFYLGLLLVLLLLQPIFKIAGLAEQLDAEALVEQLEQGVEEIR
ncbi:MAG: stage III sporulation protein AF [Lachnospiraceae bacterium]|nr:stage III sporulation protein AF [Lachnospiraceae bacterium]